MKKFRFIRKVLINTNFTVWFARFLYSYFTYEAFQPKSKYIIIIIIIIPSRYVYMFHVICCRASQKNIVHEVLDFLKKFLASISPKIIQKTENDTVGR